MQHTSYPLVVGHLTSNELASQTTTVFAPAIHMLMEVDLRWVLVVVLGLSALFSLLTVTRWHDSYHKALKAEVQPMRWIAQGVTAALMIEIAGMIAGVQDVMVLKIMAFTVLMGSMLRWYGEMQQKGARKPIWQPFTMSIVLDILPWLILIASIVATPIWGMVRQPWYAYALYLVVAVTCILGARNQYLQLKQAAKWKEYMLVERNYVVINFVSKVAFAAVLIIGLKK